MVVATVSRTLSPVATVSRTDLPARLRICGKRPLEDDVEDNMMDVVKKDVPLHSVKKSRANPPCVQCLAGVPGLAIEVTSHRVRHRVKLVQQLDSTPKLVIVL